MRAATTFASCIGRASIAQLARLDAPEIQQIVDHFELGSALCSMRGVIDGDLRIIAALERENAVPAENGIERRAQLVRKHRQNWSLPRFAASASVAQLALLLEQRRYAPPLHRQPPAAQLLTLREVSMQRATDRLPSLTVRPRNATIARARLARPVRTIRSTSVASRKAAARRDPQVCRDSPRATPLFERLPINGRIGRPAKFRLEL